MTLNNQQKEAAVSILIQMLTRLGLPAEAAVEDRQDQTVVSLKSDDPGRIIGRRGRVIENLEYLLNRALSQKFEGAVRVAIDVSGGEKDEQRPGRERRQKNDNSESELTEQEEKLRKLARDAAKEVRRWGAEIEMGPYSARERRIVHLAVQEEAGVTSESEEGDSGERKKIRITAVDH